ncbi:PLP-dependent aminotransferase family protein [Paractinoplanes brasiliensis]|uniref:DNA-binding transcriptional MocR family regulator n=1 Tax=Paractinoplanes brasiliensis TaxID=52695 RepID=A0A4R6JCQ1_9ACTN|nr:PLP-dependent aminotransferase family protein [Actinoplanes brasiliensis]TDO32326.1 DNA-binding transcriptional MocR family regulator [Actinoplanes brasiliensis]GID27807.1 aminotransferase class I/II [Actinoplanes brasiliensis]
MTIVQFEHRDGILDLGWGHPLPALLPTGAWAVASETSLRTYGWKALTYGHEPGPAPLREWIAFHLGGGGAEQTFVTAGASHGLALLTQVLTRPGDTVLVDSPTYHYAFRILTDLGVRLLPVRAEDADEVGRRAREHRAAFLYVVPTFGNPTGRSLTLPQRHALAGLGLPIVEDDPYRELYYTSPPPSFSAANVISLGSFAKTVAPGLRLGWITAAPELITRLARLGYVHSGGGVNHTTALTMAEFCASGAYHEHVALLRDRYRAHRDALAGALGTDAPDGGWFLWLRLPAGVDAEALLAVAERHGTSFVPGPAFHVDRRDGSGHVRLSFSHLPPADLTEAAGRLTVAIRSVC